VSNKGTVKSYFDKVAEGIGWLEMNYGHPLFCMRPLRRIAREEAYRRVGKGMPLKLRVIDIGCGTGWVSRELAKMFPEYEVIGVDFSEKMIERAKKLTSKDKHDYQNLLFEVADVEGLPYPSDYFDYTICSAIFSFLPGLDKALREIERILKPSGRLYVADVCKDYSPSYFGAKLFSPSNLYSRQEYKEFFDRYFVDIYQEKWTLFGGLLTVGSKRYKQNQVRGKAPSKT